MRDRWGERVVPLVLGAAVAVVTHALLIPVGAGVMQGWTSEAQPEARSLPRQEPEEALRVGDPEAELARVAWIPHADYRELVGERAETEQPAVQDEVDPVESAPLQPEPSPPTGDTAEAVEPADTEPAVEPEPPAPPPMPAEPLPLPESEASDLPAAPPQPEQPETPSEPTEQPQPEPEPTPNPREPRQAQAPGHPEQASPTATPRDESEADPTQIDPDGLERDPGGVLVGEGLRIVTQKPSFSVMSRLTAVPEDMEVELDFDAEGTVVDVRILKGSGYSDIDAGIVASLYRWRAEGDRLKQADPYLTLPLTYHLSR